MPIPIARLTLAPFAAALLVACAPRATEAPAAPLASSASAWSERLDAASRRLAPHRAPGLDERRFTHAQLWRVLEPSLSGPAVRSTPIGRSIHGRDIRAVTFGGGPTTVLLWSQMHGDEATATMAVADLLRWMAAPGRDTLRDRLARELTVVFVPMLNPDGAELFQRENAAGIDINRDARRLATPEARALKSLRDSIRPEFGFNLHDQNARTRVGVSGPQAAIALLAPAYDRARSYDEVRSRARLVAAAIAAALADEIPERIAKYDDAFTPRAFGDLMQQWGTSTVLIESGALPGDPQKQRLRDLNAAAILVALDAIATAAYRAADPAWYEALPENTGGASDLLVLGGVLALPGSEPLRADLAINFADPVARTGGTVREVGDLADAVAIDTLDASGLYVHPQPESVFRREDPASGAAPVGWLRIGAPARLDLRRGPEPTSELVRTIDF